MGLNTGETVVEGDFINQAQKNATPANDAEKAVKLEADGKLSPFFTRNGEVLTAGETLNGATLPVPVYQNTTDNELYACDANDTDRLKFLGFVTSNSTNGNPINFQGSGIVGGFSGLQEGLPYYVQDAVGTIGTTAGTNAVLVGIAISTTHLLIQKGTRRSAGSTSFADGGNDGFAQTLAVTLGFRPTTIRMSGFAPSDSSNANSNLSIGTWINGVNTGIDFAKTEGSTPHINLTNTSYLLNLYETSTIEQWRVTITSVTETGFTIRAEQKNNGPKNLFLTWEAEGDI